MSDTEQNMEVQNEEPKTDESTEDKEKPEDAAETSGSKVEDDEAEPKEVKANGDNDTEPKKEKEEEEEKDEKDKEMKEEKGEEDDDDDEDDDDEEEEEQKVGLLEQPVVLEEGSKRQRKKVERMSFASPEAEKEKIEIKEGKGTALGDIPIIEFKLRRVKATDAKPLHKLLFKRVGGPTEIKKNIKKFSGFSFEKGDSEYEKRMQMLRNKSFTKSMLSKICEILDLQRSGSKEEVSERLIDFLLEPKDSGKKVPEKKKGKGGGKVKGKGKQKKKKSKAKDSDGSDDDDKDEEDDEVQDEESDEKDDDDDEESDGDESEEEPPKKKRKTLPKPKPKEKKAPAKKTAPKKKASSKKKVESDDDDDVSDISSDDEPLEKTKQKSTPPTNDELKEVIKKMLDSANLEEVTMKSVLKDVFAKYPDHDLSDRKEFVKNTVKQIIS